MTYQSAISQQPDLESAVADVVAQCTDSSGASPTHAICFASHEYADDWDRLAATLTDQLEGGTVLGCSGESIMGRGQEIEEGPCLSLWTAAWDVPSGVRPVRLQFEQTSEGAAFVGWPEPFAETCPEGSTVLLLADPFSFPADYLLARLNDDAPGIPVLGGMASGAPQPGGNRLFLADECFTSGAVGWIIPPSVPITPVVSQGCRPIGEKMIVTASEQNRIQSLGGKPALAQLEHTFHQLPTHEQELMQRGLHIGRVVNEYQDEFEMGDFLIRNVLGVDRDANEVVVGDYIRVGTTVQFHLRDDETASSELHRLLGRAAKSQTTQAALVFSCNGRGTRLFRDPHHDASAVKDDVGDVPLAGFFAQGEIGPIGRQNFLHGFTASIALFGK